MVKEAIVKCREIGSKAFVLDHTKDWIKEQELPRFDVYSEYGSYYFKLSLDKDTTLIVSDGFKSNKQCVSTLNKLLKAIKSEDVYVTKEIHTEQTKE